MKYLLIESRDPFDSADAGYFSELVQGIVDRGHETTLFLVQNGVLPARKGSRYSDRLQSLLKNKVRILADEFSVRERAIRNLEDGIEAVPMKQFVSLLMEEGVKVLWH